MGIRTPTNSLEGYCPAVRRSAHKQKYNKKEGFKVYLIIMQPVGNLQVMQNSTFSNAPGRI